MGACCGKAPPSDNTIGPQKGEVRTVEHNDDFDGPSKKRSCTDVLFLIFFIIFLGGMGYVCYLGVLSGDPYAMIYGRDSWGNVCNKPNTPITGVVLSGRDMTGIARTFYFQFISLITSGLIKSPMVCVKSCPTTVLSTVAELQEFATNTSTQLCRYDVKVADYAIDASKCPPLPLLAHQNILNRCIPSGVIGVGQSALGAATNALSMIQAECQQKGDFWQRAISDLERTWQELAYLAAIAVGVALVMTMLLGFLAKIIIWTIVILTALGAITGTIYCWVNYYIYWKKLSAVAPEKRLSSEADLVQQWLIIASVVSAVTILLLLILLIMRKRIALVAQLFKEAGKAIIKMPLLLLQPLWTLVVLAMFVGGLSYGFLYIETAGDPTVNNGTGFVSYERNNVLFYMRWYYIFGVLWITQLVFASHQIVIAGAVSIWYFSRDKKLGWPIGTAMWRVLRYHLGSVALGAFIIALVQFARILLAYIQKKIAGKGGPIVTFIFKCIQCCLWCFEKVLKFLNRNAYIMVAIYGYSFCHGARRAFMLLIANVLRVGAINSVGTFVLFLGKLGITAIVVVVALEFVKDKLLCYMWLPVLAAGLLALLISYTFLSVYAMVIDTIFLCFCEDCDRNDGVDKPYYMSKDLMDFVENSKQALEALKNREVVPDIPGATIKRVKVDQTMVEPFDGSKK